MSLRASIDVQRESWKVSAFSATSRRSLGTLSCVFRREFSQLCARMCHGRVASRVPSRVAACASAFLFVASFAFGSPLHVAVEARSVSHTTLPLAVGDDPALLALVARLDAGDETAIAELTARGEDAALAAFVDLARVDPLARRARAHVVELVGAKRCIAPAIAALADTDAATRATLVRFLARAELGRIESAARAAALETSARGDVDPAVRATARAGLLAIDDDDSLGRLAALVDELPSGERAQAANLLASSVRARALVIERVRAASLSDRDPEGLASWLPAMARALADDPRGGETAQDRAPIAGAFRLPDPRVRRAAQVAYDALMSRLVAIGDFDRARRILAGFAAEGVDARLSAHQRARLALLDGKHTEDALAATRALEIAANVADDASSRSWRARAAQLEAVALIALGRESEASVPLAREARLLDGLLAERLDLQSKSLRGAHVDWLEQRAQLEITTAVRAIALAIPRETDAKPIALPEKLDPAAIEALRRAHTFAIEAQVVATSGDLGGARTLDPILSNDEGVLDMVLDVSRHAAWSPARALAVRLSLGRALASVAPSEAIGFEPFEGLPPEVRDPLADPRRVELLKSLHVAEIDAMQRDAAKLREAVLREELDEPAGAPPEARLKLLEFEYRFQDELATSQKIESGDTKPLLELRVPTSFVLWTARTLRDEGRSAEARPLLARAREQLDASNATQKFLWGLELLAEIEMSFGGSWSDDDEPAKAELELSKAVERLKALESDLAERPGAGAALAMLRQTRCSALVSLAVNANVKMRDTKKAVAWFEKAWELRQDDFMRVLYACYRAREGKSAEARALMREVAPGPNTYYNMACTYALLGETEPAFEFLRRELEENATTRGALERQRAWARKDPDLESLRGDPRFRKLVGGD